jgi:DNA-binding XRE family transcriptional regulator
VHEAVARFLPRHPELLDDAREQAAASLPAATRPARALPAPWREARSLDEAESYWALILTFDPDDVAAWIRAFADDGWMNATSPFFPDTPTELIRREITVLRRERHGKTHDNTKPESKLARVRVERGLTQEEMTRLTGLNTSTYWRLERKRIKNPPIGYLAVCADVLDVSLDDIVEDEYRRWRPRG